MVFKTNSGVSNITSIDIVVEKRVKMNGKTVRLVQLAEDINEATGLKVNVQTDMFEMPYGDRNIFIGNLNNATLKELVDAGAKDGCIDITGITFQKSKDGFPDSYVFDEGVSAPYICSACLGMMQNLGFGQPSFFQRADALSNIEEDSSEFDDFDNEEGDEE